MLQQLKKQLRQMLWKKISSCVDVVWSRVPIPIKRIKTLYNHISMHSWCLCPEKRYPHFMCHHYRRNILFFVFEIFRIDVPRRTKSALHVEIHLNMLFSALNFVFFSKLKCCGLLIKYDFWIALNSWWAHSMVTVESFSCKKNSVYVP